VPLTPHGRPLVGRTGRVGAAVRFGAAEVRCATALRDDGVDDVDDDAATVGDTSAAELATGTGADPAAIELGGAPLEAAGATELACVAATGWLAMQPEIASVRATPRTTHRTLWWSITAVAKRVVAALGCGAGAR
jgi:hypothetical protein